LALTRRALDLTRFQMARLLGTDTSTWGTYEAGLARIPADQALKLSARKFRFRGAEMRVVQGVCRHDISR
jgi:hypothetical protein